MTNDEVYKGLMNKLMASPAYDHDDISHELICERIEFDPYQPLSCADDNYIKQEIEWYMSGDLSIKGHPGIETNKTWSKIASNDGMVNSNYGWCIFSEQNHSQFKHAIDALDKKLHTKQAVMIYSRPSIVTEHNDNVHAKKDMICTIYVTIQIRKNERGQNVMYYTVHMRSNDVWYGMRNDLAWHQKIFELVRQHCIGKWNEPIIPGKIIWVADSLHIYTWALPLISRYLTGGTK